MSILKNYFSPKSLYGRGIMMILLPIIALQLVVGTLIVQRYFFNMTDALTGHVIKRIEFIEKISQTPDEFSAYMNLEGFTIIDNFEPSHFGLFDLTGRRIKYNFENAFGPEVLINNEGFSRVKVSFPFNGERLAIEAPRVDLAPINPHQILLNTTGFAVVMTLFSMVFLRNQTRSLSRLSHAAKAFGRGESVEYTPRGALEVRSAGRSFLAMRNRITRQREQRSLLLSGVSHDLRTPLTRMRLQVELIDDEETREGLKQDIQALEALSESFLNYATTDIQEDFETRDLAEEIRAVTKDFENVTVQHLDECTHRLRPLLFKRALSNLLSNGERYADKINVSMRISGRDVVITIDDNGPGITPEQRAEATKAFTRLDPARSSTSGNHAGLGLAIAADVVRQHGGEMELGESQLGGLEVKITLPQKIDV